MSESKKSKKPIATDLLDEAEVKLFENAMIGVRRIESTSLKSGYTVKKEISQIRDEALENLENGSFISLIEGENIEVRSVDLNRVDFECLKRGELAVQGRIDLHGKKQKEATIAIKEFFRVAILKKHRCLLVICGRGLRSFDNKAVLKELLVELFTHGVLSRFILGFCSAKPRDGGTGALYVLLRRKRAS